MLLMNLHLRKIILTHVLISSIAMHAFYTLIRGLLTRIEELGTTLSVTNGCQSGKKGIGSDAGTTYEVKASLLLSQASPGTSESELESDLAPAAVDMSLILDVHILGKLRLFACTVVDRREAKV
jgi:hypothetical protein